MNNILVGNFRTKPCRKCGNLFKRKPSESVYTTLCEDCFDKRFEHRKKSK